MLCCGMCDGRVPQPAKDPIVAVSFAAHGSREVQARGPAPAGADGDTGLNESGEEEEEEEESQMAGDVAAAPELAAEEAGHAQRVAGVSDRVRMRRP